ncbi:hypothetical protein BCR43DRAFT_295995 [Syncephalastrum racemosum]|uniref:Uncharacterized protein n=1 Tax=Syncephalastrum racemosum TaxID=13706 RepID=A0A1X2H999_SYNRA|nr:hypothetical protein BCR43DRAFT_295995 [Syncephalastrum racemosum]
MISALWLREIRLSIVYSCVCPPLHFIASILYQTELAYIILLLAPIISHFRFLSRKYYIILVLIPFFPYSVVQASIKLPAVGRLGAAVSLVIILHG